MIQVMLTVGVATVKSATLLVNSKSGEHFKWGRGSTIKASGLHPE